MNIAVSYHGSWKGNYSFGDEDLEYGRGSCGNCSIVRASFSGDGNENESFIFANNYCGFGFFVSVSVNKNDGSNAVLNLSSNVSGWPIYSDSTSAPFGNANVGFDIEC